MRKNEEKISSMSSVTIGRSKARLRVVRCRGRIYIQEVLYYWDRTLKKGVTKVIRHIGPADPINHNRYAIAEISAARQRLYKERNERLSLEAKRKSNQKTKNVKRQYYPLNPSEWMRRKVLEIVESEMYGITRNGVINKFEKDVHSRDIDEKSLPTIIGITLTALYRDKALGRSGNGIRGNPFVYKRAPRKEAK